MSSTGPIIEYRATPEPVEWQILFRILMPGTAAALVSVIFSIVALAWAHHAHGPGILSISPHAKLDQWLIEDGPGYLNLAGAVISALWLIGAVCARKLKPWYLFCLGGLFFIFFCANFWIVINGMEAFP